MFTEIRLEDVDWICVAQGKAQWRSVVKTVKTVRVAENEGEIFTDCAFGSIWRFCSKEMAVVRSFVNFAIFLYYLFIQIYGLYDKNVTLPISTEIRTNEKGSILPLTKLIGATPCTTSSG